MTTSGVTAWSLTARDIITEALHENAVLGLGEDVPAPEADRCLTRLNGLLKSWLVGRNLERTGAITVLANAASGAIDAAINEVRSVRVLENQNFERQLTRWERDEYFRIPNKSASGAPTAFYADAQRDSIVLYLWPVPTADTTLKVEYQRLPETVTNLNETVDFPQEYQEALYANLAVRCCTVFGVEPKVELLQRARDLRIEMEDRERPASYTMEPDW